MPATRLRAALNGSKLRGRRRRAQRPALAAVAVLAFLLGGVAAGLVGYVGAVARAAVQDTFDDVPATERVFQLSARVADDPGAQDDTAAVAFERFVGEAPYSLHRSLLTEPRQLLDPDAPQAEGADAGLPRIALAAYESLAEHADLVAGDWPGDAEHDARLPVALHEDAASALGIELGDELAFEERRQLAELVVVGLWRPSDPGADYWFASSLETAGVAGGDGLAVLTEEDLLDLPGPVPVVRWRLAPGIDTVTLADLSELRLGLPRIRPYLADDPLFRDAGIGVADDIIAGLEGTDNALLASRSVAIAPMLLAVVSAIGAIGLMSRLLSQNRLTETLLLRGRGWSRTQAIGWALRESVRVFAVPAVLGGAAGYGALRIFTGQDLDVPLSAVAVGTGVVIAAGVVTLIIAAARAAGPAHVTVEHRATAGRRQVVGRTSGVIIVFAVAALATWQLRRYNGVTVLDSAGVRELDPLAVAAPAAILLAAAVTVAGGIMVVGRIAERVLNRRRGVAGVHAARVLARQPAGYVLPVVLIGLAAGSGTFASGYTSTWHNLQGDVAAERTAADVEIELGGSRVMTSTIDPLTLAEYEEIGGVREAVAAMSRSAQLADGEVGVVATGGDDPANGIELPAGTSTAEIEIAGELQLLSEETGERELLGGDGEPIELAGSVHVWLVDADGSGGVVETGPLRLATAAPDAHVSEIELPPGAAEPLRIVAVDVRLELPADPSLQADFTVSIAEVRADDAAVPVPSDGWSALAATTPDQTPYSVSSTGAALARLTGSLPLSLFGVNTDLTTRLVHGAEPIAATATDAALGTFGLAVGDEAGLDVLGSQLPITVAGRTPAIPGSGRPEALAVDLNSLITAVLNSGGQPPAPDRIWLTTDPSAGQEAIADAAAALAGPDSTVSSRAVVEAGLVDSRLSQLVITTFWLVAVVAAGLAVIGVWSATVSSLGSRRAEVGVLRALGFSAAQQGRQRRREMLLLGLLATVLGGTAGYVAGWIAVPPLAGSATPGLPESVEPVPDVDWPSLAGFAAVLAVVLTVIVVGYGARVRRQAEATFAAEVSA